MRRIFSFIITIFFCLAVYAEKIPLKPIDPGKRGDGNDKSEILVPNAEIENGVINVETALASWGVSVTVYNNIRMRSIKN